MVPFRPLTLLPMLALLASPCPAQEPVEHFSVKISLSREDPDLAVGEHAGTDPVEFYVFVDGDRSRGGEFGLALSGGTCLGFLVDPDLPWITLPMVRPYPGTIAQVTAGDECYETPLCFGKMLVRPAASGGRIVVDVIPSERAQEVALIGCDYAATNWFLAHPAVVNPGDGKAPDAHLVSRPADPVQLIPEEAVGPPPGKGGEGEAN